MNVVIKKISLLSLLLLLLCSLPLFGQGKATAEIGGTVKDSSGAVVPGAKVTATGADTGVAREVQSEADGSYRFVLLPPGSYDLKLEKTGFVAQLKKGIAVTVGQFAAIDFELQVGQMTQLVEITGEAPLVETERAQQSNTIESRAVQNLPINRRDYLAFALLAPGLSDSKAMADNTNARVKQTPDSGISFYGSNGRGNNVTVDGGEANDSGGGVRNTVSQETVQEFQINRTNYTAEHGGARGGVINIVTKSGGNNFRGSVFGFFRNQNLDAGDPFALVYDAASNRLNRVKPDSNRQQIGFSLGGPLVKDRTFFFTGLEHLRRRETNAVVVLLDNSVFGPTAQQQAVLNTLPAAVAAGFRQVLASPQSTIDLFTRNSGLFPFETNDTKFLMRLDHRANDRNQFSFRYNLTKSDESNTNVRAQVGVTRGFLTEATDHNVLGGWTHSFSPSLINDFRAQFNFSRPVTGTNDPFGPELNITGFGRFNRDIFLPSTTITRRTDLSDSLIWTHGSHSIKFGGGSLIRNNNSNSATFFGGRFNFGALPMALLAAVLPPTLSPFLPQFGANQLTALQAFNLGAPQSYQQGFGDPVVKATYPLYSMYVQDAWKVRPNLTLNFGLRYEIDTRKSPMPTDKNNFAPRFGFAWDPFGDKKTTIRGGYGMFFATTDFQIDYVVNALNEINGYRQIAQLLTTLSAANPLAANGPINIYQTLRARGVLTFPFPSRTITPADLAQFGIAVSQTGPRPPLTVLFKNSADFQNAYTQQMSFGIERELVPGFSVSGSGIFVRGAKINRAREDNLLPVAPCAGLPMRYWGSAAIGTLCAAVPATSAFKQPLLLQDNIYESTANSWYSGIVLEANKRFSRNFSVAFNYTLSRALDEALDFNSGFQPNDQLNMRAERALSSFHQKHKVVAYSVMQGPSWSAATNGWQKLAADFTFTPIYRYNSSRPFNLLSGFEINQDRHSDTDRPIGMGRNTGAGPSFWTFDFRLARKIPVGEGKAVELMFEAFNLFNHTNFASLNNEVCSGRLPLTVTDCIASRFSSPKPLASARPDEAFGYTSALDPRRIQLGVRFSF